MPGRQSRSRDGMLSDPEMVLILQNAFPSKCHIWRLEAFWTKEKELQFYLLSVSAQTGEAVRDEQHAHGKLRAPIP